MILSVILCVVVTHMDGPKEWVCLNPMFFLDPETSISPAWLQTKLRKEALLWWGSRPLRSTLKESKTKHSFGSQLFHLPQAHSPSSKPLCHLTQVLGTSQARSYAALKNEHEWSVFEKCILHLINGGRRRMFCYAHDWKTQNLLMIVSQREYYEWFLLYSTE